MQKTLAAVNESQPMLAAATPSATGLVSMSGSGTSPPNDNIVEPSSPSVGALHATSTTLPTIPTAISTANIAASQEKVADAVSTSHSVEDVDSFPIPMPATTSIQQLLQLHETIQQHQLEQRQLEQQLFGTMAPSVGSLNQPLLPNISDDDDSSSDEASNGAPVSS